MNRIAAVVAGLSLAFVGTSASFADTINVPGDYPTIQGAINASSNGDVINIAAGTYNEHSLNPGGKAITIQGTLNGDGSLATTIDAEQGGRVFMINSQEDSGTVIQDLIITGGGGASGAGIYCGYNSGPTISGCTITGNEGSWYGGGINCSTNSSPTISGCTISENTARYGGGIHCYATYDTTIIGCTIIGNTATYGGGGINSNDSNPTISGCTIEGNSADILGGGIHCRYSNPNIIDSLICGNAPDQIDGSYNDAGGNNVADECPEESCADLNNSGLIDIEDLLLLIGYWGTSDGDCDADGDTDIEDLLYLIGSWGASC